MIGTYNKPQYDVLIIGGGPIGLACGLAAKLAGLTYLIVEKGALVNSLYNYPVNMTFFSTSDRLEIGGVPFVSLNVKPTRNEALEYYRRVAVSKELNLCLFEKIDKVIRQTDGSFQVISHKSIYHAQNIVVATGFYDVPVLLGIPGETLEKVTHYYKEPHLYFKQKVVVVGANNSAVDAALETYRKGAEVTLVIQGTDVGERVKYWSRPDIVNRIKEGDIKAYFNAQLVQIFPDAVEIATPEGLVRIENDYVIAATGYQPDFSFLTTIGIHLSADDKRYPTYDPDTQESNQAGIYLAGVICGGMDTHVWFIENSRVHAERIVNAIAQKRNNAG